MIKILFKIFLVFMFSFSIHAQQTGYKEDFEDGDINGWVPDHVRTFQLSNENNSLKINYTRTSSSDKWDNFNFTLPTPVDIKNNALITVRVKSSISASLSFKPIFQTGDQYISQTLDGDNIWHTISFKVDEQAEYVVNKIYMYLDGGSTDIKSGVVYFDDVRLGDSAFVEADFYQLEKAITKAELLYSNAIEGNGEGFFIPGSKSILKAVIDDAVALRNSGETNQSVVDKALWDLLDACVNLEISVNSLDVGLSDQKATRETRYSYLNLKNLQGRFLLYGMHDATGYGVGWTGDNDRSDVKSVTGDYPALFSEDASGIDNDPFNSAKEYRLSTAANNGSIVTVSWHQKDPQGRGFYSKDVNNENIVRTILPGGEYHLFYKDRLKKVATFFKGLRDNSGFSIPIIFRPYHEHTGGWFWWGAGQCSVQEYNSLWIFTKEYLRDSLNVHNLIYAISPASTGLNNVSDYEKIYPGDEYIDIMGGDYYFASPASYNDPANYLKFLRVVGGQTIKTNKVGAVTEVGQEGLKNSDWHTKYLLPSLKSDSLASNLVYAAVWRNANTTHHYAPYPGHPSVPDFIDFYNDPYTLFQNDLPQMYKFPAEDKQAPKFISVHDTVYVSPYKEVTLEVTTDEKAFLRYSFVNKPYDQMEKSFTIGGGKFIHSTVIDGTQGEVKTVYVHAADIFDNKTTEPLVINFTVDTMRMPITWKDPRFPDSGWKLGAAPLGSSSTAVTNTRDVQTIYFRKSFELSEVPASFAVYVKSAGGAVVYINNNEVGRINFPDNDLIDYNSEPTSGAAFNKNFVLDSLALSYIRTGQNLIGIEIHSAAGNNVSLFDARTFTASSVIFNLGSEWLFFDEGYEPEALTLGEITGVKPNSVLPVSHSLMQNYPNPFNPSTRISFYVATPTRVNLTIYNMLGEKVMDLADDFFNSGFHSVECNATNLSSGMYMVLMKAGEYTGVTKIMLLK